MMSGGAGAPSAAQAARIAARTVLGGERLAVAEQAAAVALGAADELLGRGHAGLGGALGAADAGQLGRRLDAAAGLDRSGRRR